jgi:hypothetical protein
LRRVIIEKIIDQIDVLQSRTVTAVTIQDQMDPKTESRLAHDSHLPS